MEKNISYYYKEWQLAHKSNDSHYADHCKEKYRELMMKSIVKQYHYFNEVLKQYPLIYLN